MGGTDRDREGSEPSVAAEIRRLKGLVRKVLLRDRQGLQRRLKDLGRRSRAGGDVAADLEGVRERCAASQAVCQARRDALPRVTYPDELPISQRRDDIAAALLEHPVVVVAGETGSGKTTQLPKIGLDLGRGIAGRIGCTQPRRIAAMTCAERVAAELATPLGETVGYQIRFRNQTTARTAVKFMTDGVLLAEIRRDRRLLQYDTLIVDEVHERSLNIDFLLGYLKQLLPRRPELRVVLSSATLDVERFQEYFGNAPLVRVEGRAWPVDVRYRPLQGEEGELNLPVGVEQALEEVLTEPGDGDVLVFLPTEQDIRETREHLDRSAPPDVLLLPLFGRLTPSEQRRVFEPHRQRKVVLATNVAETSVTVPGIAYVIDAGTARIRRYRHQTQVEHLGIERISQASAEQRKGRCGRIGPGVCIRLYGEDDFAERVAFTDPEIVRSSLASVILHMTAMGLGAVESFPFLEPPAPAMIKRGYAELEELGALSERRTLTRLGKRMARLPVEPRHGRMLLEAERRGCLREMIILVSALSIRDPRERPLERQGAADACHRQHHDAHSDFTAWLNLWRFYHRETKALRSGTAVRRFCRENFLSFLRMREWANLCQQLEEDLAALGARPRRRRGTREAIHRSLLSGLLSRIGRKVDRPEYEGAHSTWFRIHPGSGLSGKRPAWVVAAELVQTSRLYARTVAAVTPEWIEAQAGERCRRSYTLPRWDEETGHVRAFERVTVFGLPVVQQRTVHYGPVDPVASRQILIEEGLVEGRMPRHFPFLEHNQKLLQRVVEMQHKARRSDLLVDREALCAFYEKRLPVEITTAKALYRWWQEARRREPRILYLTEADVLLVRPDGLSPDRFPESLAVGGHELEVRYRFAPGEADDGMTFVIPVGVLQTIPDWPFEWLCPGLLGEKVALLLRGLPRRERRVLVPVPNAVSQCLPELRPYGRPLGEALSAVLGTLRGLEIPVDRWREVDLPAFVRPHFCIVDADGNTMASGRDLAQLRQALRRAAQEHFREATRDRWQRSGLTDWTFGSLPPRVELEAGGGTVVGFPTLIDEGESVALHLAESEGEARVLLRRGLGRLYTLVLAPQVRRLGRSLPLAEPAELIYHGLGGSVAGLREDLVEGGIEQVFLTGDDWAVRDAEAFRARLAARTKTWRQICARLAQAVSAGLQASARARAAVQESSLPEWARDDLLGQIGHLVFPGFVREAPLCYLERLPQYAAAIEARLEKIGHSPGKDRRKQERVAPFWRAYRERRQSLAPGDEVEPGLVAYRWLVEEFRLSLFAQEMGTREPVSEKRLRRAWRDATGTDLPG